MYKSVYNTYGTNTFTVFIWTVYYIHICAYNQTSIKVKVLVRKSFTGVTVSRRINFNYNIQNVFKQPEHLYIFKMNLCINTLPLPNILSWILLRMKRFFPLKKSFILMKDVGEIDLNSRPFKWCHKIRVDIKINLFYSYFTRFSKRGVVKVYYWYISSFKISLDVLPYFTGTLNIQV